MLILSFHFFIVYTILSQIELSEFVLANTSIIAWLYTICRSQLPCHWSGFTTNILGRNLYLLFVLSFLNYSHIYFLVLCAKSLAIW